MSACVEIHGCCQELGQLIIATNIVVIIMVMCQVTDVGNTIDPSHDRNGEFFGAEIFWRHEQPERISDGNQF